MMNKLVTVNAQEELHTNARLEKILSSRRAGLAEKTVKKP
jgi:hypothetical protein